MKALAEVWVGGALRFVGHFVGHFLAQLVGLEASGVEGRFISWVDALLMPQLDHEMLHRLPLANWRGADVH